MSQKPTPKLTKEDIEKLLNRQTLVILNAVDQKLSTLEKRISKLEIKMDQRFNQLITTLDKFLKRLTDLEDEFESMKADLKRVKMILKEKLGVAID